MDAILSLRQVAHNLLAAGVVSVLSLAGRHSESCSPSGLLRCRLSRILLRKRSDKITVPVNFDWFRINIDNFNVPFVPDIINIAIKFDES